MEFELNAQFTVAWPVWAGGYPSPEQALDAMNRARERLRDNFSSVLRSYLDTPFTILDLGFDLGGYTPIENLRPKSQPPNSLHIYLKMRTTALSFSRYETLDWGLQGLVVGLGNSLESFSRLIMGSGSIYDVRGRFETRLDVRLPMGGETISSRFSSSAPAYIERMLSLPGNTKRDTISLAEWVDSQVDTGSAQPLHKLGPWASAVHEVLQSEQRAASLIANTFWQSYVRSRAFVRDLKMIHVNPAAVFQQEILVVAHGLFRYSLLLTDPGLSEGTRAFKADVNRNELIAGWGAAAQSHGLSQSFAKLESDLFPLPVLAPSHVLNEVVGSQNFSVLVTPPLAEEATSIPFPHVPVQCDGKLSTAGAYVQDEMHRVGVTAAAHALAPYTPITVDGQPGDVVSRDALTDSCFVHVPGLVTRPNPSHGPLRLAPRQHDPVTFEGAVTQSGRGQVVAWNYELPAIDPNLQQTVRTDQVTSQGDSGAALLDSSGYIVGFAHSRSGMSSGPTYSSWIWAAAVFQRHGLTPY
jgi:hypothetical protein